jgi:hypothetical protein
MQLPTLETSIIWDRSINSSIRLNLINPITASPAMVQFNSKARTNKRRKILMTCCRIALHRRDCSCKITKSIWHSSRTTRSNWTLRLRLMINSQYLDWTPRIYKLLFLHPLLTMLQTMEIRIKREFRASSKAASQLPMPILGVSN